MSRQSEIDKIAEIIKSRTITVMDFSEKIATYMVDNGIGTAKRFEIGQEFRNYADQEYFRNTIKPIDYKEQQ